MTSAASVPAWAALLTAALVLLGATFALIGSIGLLKFKTFYERVHSPSLGATLGMFSILSASIVFFSVSQTRPVVHEFLIGAFITVTTPVFVLLLVQATSYRDRLEGRKAIPDAKGDHTPAP